jgi:uncharacterized protein (DUF1786 family)
VAGAPGRDEGGGLLTAHRQELDRQDAVLDAISDAAARLGEMGADIHAELSTQAVALDALETEVDDTSAAVREATARTQALIRASGGYGWCCGVAGLSVVAFVLFLIVLWG